MITPRKLRNRRPRSSENQLKPCIRPVLEGLEERRLLAAIAFDVASLAVNEDAGVLTVNVVRTGPGLDQPASVNYSVSGGTATAGAGADFTVGGGGILNFLANETTASFTVTITDDAAPEPAETIILQLGGIVGADTLGEPSTQTITINTSDGFVPPVLTMPAPVSVSESVAGGNVVLTVVRSANTTAAVSANYSITAGTATAGADYTDVSGTINFGIGETTATITIPILPDTDPEADETLTVQIGALTGGAILGVPATTLVTILDNDAVVAFDPAAVSVNEGAGTATLTVTRTGGLSGTTTVNFATVAGTAFAGTDFTATSNTLTFVPGDTTETIVIPIVNDTAVDPAKTFTVVLSGPVGGAVGAAGTATVTITDDEVPGTFAIQNATYSFNENAGTVTITVLRTGGSSGAVTVPFFVAGTAQTPADYAVTTASPLTFAASETSKQISIAIVDDAIDDNDETIIITLQNPSFGDLGAIAATTATIVDNDAPGTFAIANATCNFSETVPTATITVLRTGGSAGTVTLDFVVTPGTATTPADYTVTTASPLTFGPGETSKEIIIPLVNDANDEQDETFTVEISNPSASGVLGAITTTTVTIADDEGAGTFAFAQPVYSFVEGLGTVTVAVVRTNGTAGEVNVPFTVTNGTADGTDFTIAATSVTFAAGETSKTISIALTDDLLDEADRTFSIGLDAPSAGDRGAVTSTMVTIVDNDGPGEFSFTQTTATVAEGGQVVLTIQRALGATGTVTVSYAVTGTAAAGDYTIIPATPITFAEGEISKTITVGAVQDLLIEVDETVIVTLSDPTGGATLGVGIETTVTIINDDAAGILAFQQATYTVNEGGTATITVVRTDGVSGTVTVPFTITGTATGGADYTLAAGTLTFAEGVTSRTITIPTVQDLLQESNETIILTLGTAGGGALLGTPGVTTLTIVDDDTVNVAPTALPVGVVRAPGQTIAINVRPSIADANGDPLTVSVASAPQFGTVVVNDNGTPLDPTDDVFVYTPAVGQTRNDRFTYRATDPRGATVDAQVSIQVRGAGLVISPIDAATMDLVVVGTVDDDQVFLARAGASGNTNVRVNGDFYGPFVPTGRIIVLASTGDDSVEGRGLANSLWVYGNSGNDTVLGSSRGDVLLGQAGNDVLKGLNGNDILIGGTGRDWLIGNNGIDVLIGGSHDLEAYTPAAQSDLADALLDLGEADSMEDFIDSNGSVFSNDLITDDGNRDTLDGRADADWLIGQGELFKDVDDSDVLSEDIG